MDNPSIKRVETVIQYLSINDTETNVTRSPSDTPRAKQSNLGISGPAQAFSDRLLSEKSDSTDANLVISVENLLNPSVSSISKNSSKLTLKIENLKELQAMQILLTNQATAEFIDRINTLDLSAITIDKNTKDLINVLLITIFQNPNFNSNLTTLIFGDITPFSSFALPDLANNIKYFSIGDIESSFTLPNSFNQIITINTGGVHAKVYLRLPKLLNELEALTIKYVGDMTVIGMPLASLNKLTTLNIGNMGHKAKFKISDSDNIINLTIGNIANDSALTLPTSLPNLKNLTIHGSATRTLPTSLNSLEMLYITHIYNDATRALLVSLDNFINLKMLVTGDIHDNTTINLPTSLNNLTIGNTKNNCTLTLSVLYPTSIKLGDMGIGAILKLQNPFDSLITLVFGTIQDDATRKLLESIKAQTESLKNTEKKSTIIAETATPEPTPPAASPEICCCQ